MGYANRNIALRAKAMCLALHSIGMEELPFTIGARVVRVAGGLINTSLAAARQSFGIPEGSEGYLRAEIAKTAGNPQLAYAPIMTQEIFVDAIALTDNEFLVKYCTQREKLTDHYNGELNALLLGIGTPRVNRFH